MSIQTQRGHLWNENERQMAKSFQRRIRPGIDKLTQQLRLMRQYAPEFFPVAQPVADKFLGPAKLLMAVNARKRGRKYQPISADEAQDLLRQLTLGIVEWNMLMSSPEAIASARRAEQRRREQVQLARKNGVAKSTEFDELLHLLHGSRN